MNITESIRVALDGLRTNKMRSFLTMLGIIIGIASVISIMTVGRGLSGSVQKSMSSMGARNVTIMVQNRDPDDGMSGDQAPRTADDMMTPEMIEAVQLRFGPEIDGLGISEGGPQGEVRVGEKTAKVTLNGINEGQAQIDNVKMLFGRGIKAEDVKGGRSVAVVSDRLVTKLFGKQLDKALGKEISVTLPKETPTYSIVGIYKYEQPAFANPGASTSDPITSAHVPLPITKKMNNSGSGYSTFTVIGKVGIPGEELGARISDFLNRYYENNKKFHITAMSMEKLAAETTQLMSGLSLGLSVIGGISLLVGGIGVMNIMLVSVTERTREIGVRKALGASNTNIRIQFIVESMIVCLIGGAIGVGLGAALGYVGSNMMKAPSLPSIGAILFALGFSMAIGMFFGYYPANKAAQLDPIEALRYE
ncbi:MAG: ABC transporter permease [Actinomycetaceae bacterium]|nr:ABC transporter permease [Actinomycetaceae bacterium]